MRRCPRRSVAGTLFVLLGALALAGCGGGGKPSGSVGSDEATASVTPPNGPIVVGLVGTFSAGGPAQSPSPRPSVAGASGGGIDPGGAKALTAWAAYTNAHGGLLGRQVRVVVKDDGGNAATSLAAVKELVEVDHVVAILSDHSDVDGTWRRYLDGKNIPVVGGRPDSPAFLSDSAFFPSGAGIVALTYGAQVAAKAHGTNVGLIVCAETEQCALQARVQREMARYTGIRLAVDESVSPGATDYTLLCQKLAATNVQSYQVVASSATVVAIASACAAQGVTAPIVLGGVAADPSWVTSSALSGATVVDGQAPWFDVSVPGVATYRQAITDFVAGGLGADDGPGALDAWTSGQLFAKAVLASGSATPTGVRDGLYALRGQTLDGLVAPITYRTTGPTQLTCYGTLVISGGAFTSPQGPSPTCAPDAVVAAVVGKVS